MHKALQSDFFLNFKSGPCGQAIDHTDQYSDCSDLLRWNTLVITMHSQCTLWLILGSLRTVCKFIVFLSQRFFCRVGYDTGLVHLDHCLTEEVHCKLCRLYTQHRDLPWLFPSRVTDFLMYMCQLNFWSYFVFTVFKVFPTQCT